MNKFWWQADKGLVNQSVFKTLDFLNTNQSYRSQANLRHMRLYGNSDMLGLTVGNYFRAGNDPASDARLRLNICQSIIDTVTAKIAKNRPRPMFLTEGGNFNAQQKAKKLNRFSEGQIYAQGLYEEGPQIFRDGCILGDGFVKKYVYDGKICAERVLSEEIKVDDCEAMYGAPKSLHQLRTNDREVLKALYPKSAEFIEAAKRADKGILTSNYLTEQIEIAESWHLPSTKDSTDGRHIISIRGADLLDEKWTLDRFPLIKFSWSRRQLGWFGQGLCEQLAPIQYEINKLLRVIQKSMHLVSVPKVFLPKGSKVVTSHINNEIFGIVEYVGDKPPTPGQLANVPRELFEQLDRLVQRAYEIAGISQLSAQAKKPDGLDSGKALREFYDIESERFATVEGAWEQFFMQSTKLDIALCKQAAEGDEDLQVKFVDKKGIEILSWDDVDLDEDQYVMQMFPTSMLPKTPAGKLATIQEMLQAGLINQEDGTKLLDFPDLESTTNTTNAMSILLDKIVEKIIDDADYIGPEPYMNFQYCIPRMQLEYLKAKCENVPEDRLELFRTWMEQAQTLSAPPANAVEPGAPTAVPAAPPVSDLMALPTANPM